MRSGNKTTLYLASASIPNIKARMSRQALALMFVKLRVYSFDIYLVFFGFWCILIGYLIFRSTFLPRILGVLVAISGLGWVTYLSPQLANHLWPAIATASALGEIPLEFWLIVMGLNVQRWKEQASAAGMRT